MAERRVAVVAACYEFPIYSHSFVYEEMLGLREMGFELRLFCWKRADPLRLHAAFAALWRCLHVLDTDGRRHAHDYAYFRERAPARVHALMQDLSVSLGKPVAELERDGEVLMAFTFAREAERAGARYIHTYFFYEETFFGLVAARLLGVPRGVSCYADHMLADSRYKDFALQFDQLDVAVATSRRIRSELITLAGEQHADKIVVKPNGVDGRRIPRREPGAHGRGTAELISVSRIEPKKGLLQLCDVARLLKQRGRRARIHVVGAADPATAGSPEYARDFAARRRALCVDDMFVMHGFLRQEQLLPLLRRADVFLAPYVEMENGDKDGIPTSLLEAMAAGVPAVCTDAGSITEAIEHGVEGLIVPQNDPSGLAAAVARVLDEPAFAEQLAAAARRRFELCFDTRVTEPRLHARIAPLLAPA